MLMKCDPNPEVIKHLSHIIRECFAQWKNLPKGNCTEIDFNKQPLPGESDVDSGSFLNNYPTIHLNPFKRKEKFERLTEFLKINDPLIKDYQHSNAIVYAPMTCMRWHTNSSFVGLRTYYTFTNGKGIFRYIDENGNVIDDHDNKGWTVRKFQVTRNPGFWHTVWTEQTRFSFGFMSQ